MNRRKFLSALGLGVAGVAAAGVAGAHHTVCAPGRYAKCFNKNKEDLPLVNELMDKAGLSEEQAFNTVHVLHELNKLA